MLQSCFQREVVNRCSQRMQCMLCSCITICPCRCKATLIPPCLHKNSVHHGEMQSIFLWNGTAPIRARAHRAFCYLQAITKWSAPSPSRSGLPANATPSRVTVQQSVANLNRLVIVCMFIWQVLLLRSNCGMSGLGTGY